MTSDVEIANTELELIKINATKNKTRINQVFIPAPPLVKGRKYRRYGEISRRLHASAHPVNTAGPLVFDDSVARRE
jgi:hypothetical protein